MTYDSVKAMFEAPGLIATQTFKKSTDDKKAKRKQAVLKAINNNPMIRFEGLFKLVAASESVIRRDVKAFIDNGVVKSFKILPDGSVGTMSIALKAVA